MVQKNEKFKSVGKVKFIQERNLPKREAEMSGGALKLQKSQECCRRKEESGRRDLQRRTGGMKWNSPEKGQRRMKKRELSGRKDPQNTINKPVPSRKASKLVPSISQQK